MNDDNSQSPFLKPKEAPKKAKPIGGAMGFFDLETEAENPLGSNSTDKFYESLKDAPFNLFDPSKPSESFVNTAETQIHNIYGTIDFEESNRKAEEEQRVVELKSQIEQSGIVVEEKPVEKEKSTDGGWADYVAVGQESEKFDLGELNRVKDYVRFGEFFSIIGSETLFGFNAIKSLIVENILPAKKNPKVEAMQKMTPEEQMGEQKKQKVKRAQSTFYSRLRDITRGMSQDMARALRGRQEGANKQIGISESFSGSIDEKTGELRIDLQVLAEKKNSEMKEAEIKVKKQQQMAIVTKGGKNLRTHLGAQEGQSMVANAVLTAG